MSETRIVKAAAETVCDEITSLLQIIEITGTVSRDRIPGIKERIKQLRRMLK